MKIKSLSIIILCGILNFSCTKALTQPACNQTITATLGSFVEVINSAGSSDSVNINNDGTLSSSLAPSFNFISNDKTGVVAMFNVKVMTSDGEVNAMQGLNNTSMGKIVLANTQILTNSSSVKNALSLAPTAVNNAGAIAYKIVLQSVNSNIGACPVFNSSGMSAGGNVLTKNGKNTIILYIDKNSVQVQTFSADDPPGSYQAMIYCTSAAL